jgi:hypothetical protein
MNDNKFKIGDEVVYNSPKEIRKMVKDLKVAKNHERKDDIEPRVDIERLEMMCRMFNDTYHDALEFKEQRDELLEAAKYSLKIVETFPCECDTYNGVKCNKHNWKKKLERVIQKVVGKEKIGFKEE